MSGYLVDLSELEGAFSFEEGFTRPNWQLIAKQVEQTVKSESLNQAWTQVARQWAERLKDDLGGDYQITESIECLLLSAVDDKTKGRLLEHAGRAAGIIPDRLGDAAYREGYGKHLLLLFEEEDDYYQYISYFYPEGNHPASSGVFVHDYYQHIAIYNVDEIETAQTITHELAHFFLGHLPIPVWLNEGLAMTFHRVIAGLERFSLDHDSAERHLTFWSHSNIQEFWAGTSWGQPGESSQLSYGLAEILMQLLLGDWRDFTQFVQNAHYSDAGQTASMDYLGKDLGEMIAGFLGAGNWRPNRKAIADLLKPHAADAASGGTDEAAKANNSGKENPD
jgi:hypothetical protein